MELNIFDSIDLEYLGPTYVDVEDQFSSQSFLIHGDGLFAELIEREALDWEHGGQFLHLVFLFECRLRDLQSSISSETTLFFDLDFRALLSHVHHPSVVVAWDMVIHHLCVNTSLRVKVLDRKDETQQETMPFVALLKESNAASVFLSDGRFSTTNEDVRLFFLYYMIICVGKRCNLIYFSGSTLKRNRYHAFSVTATARKKDWALKWFDEVDGQLNDLMNSIMDDVVGDHLCSDVWGWTTAIVLHSLEQLIHEHDEVLDLSKMILISIAFKESVPLSIRAQHLCVESSFVLENFLSMFFKVVSGYSRHCPSMKESTPTLADFFDGRLFWILSCWISRCPWAREETSMEKVANELGLDDLEKVEEQWNAISCGRSFLPLFSSSIDLPTISSTTPSDQSSTVDQEIGLFPIRNRLVDSIHGISTTYDDDDDDDDLTMLDDVESRLEWKEFFEKYHWHSGRPVDDVNDIQSSHPSSDRERRWQLTVNQKYALFMERYASDLHGDNNHITIPSAKVDSRKSRRKDTPPRKTTSKHQTKKVKESNKDRIRRQATAERKEKQLLSQRNKLDGVLNIISRLKGSKDKLKKIDEFLHNEDLRPAIIILALIERIVIVQSDNVEILNSIFNLLDVEVEEEESLKQKDRDRISILPFAVQWIMSRIGDMNEQGNLARNQLENALEPICGREFSTVKTEKQWMRMARKDTTWNSIDVNNIHRTSLSCAEFQLEHMGPMMKRNTGSIKDPRVRHFKPDAWQRKLLDAVDANRSALVVAPTSSGKTFISYYCIESVLRESDDGVVVYVSPTKALVNQVAADMTRFRKHDRKKGLWGLFTRDYRHNPLHCQILVTVPACLEILLFSPLNREWVKRLRYVIFDEVHQIGASDAGKVWEHLILMIDCPFLALSATVEKPIEFYNWLCRVRSRHQAKDAREVELIVHSKRFNDLRSHLFVPPPGYEKHTTLRKIRSLEDEPPTPGKDYKCIPIHPFVALTVKDLIARGGIPESIQLSPEEALRLYQALLKVCNDEDDDMVKRLHPDTFFQGTISISRDQVRNYESKLKDVVSGWIKTNPKMLGKLLKVLSARVEKEFSRIEKQKAYAHHFPLLARALHANQQLPAIVFSLSKKNCERLAIELSNWLTRCREALPPAPARKESRAAKKSKLRLAEQQKRSITRGESPEMEMIEPESMPKDPLSFASGGGISSEWMEQIDGLASRVKPELITALKLGIGVHHASMPLRYRQLVERMFRNGIMQIVVATSTLALGIHMPCKTVVFAGHTKYLNSLEFRQMKGRAGRRGFDKRGNVILFAIPLAITRRLMGSGLPELRGSFPVTASTVLRSMILYHQVEATARKEMGENNHDEDFLEKQTGAVMRSIGRLFEEPFFAKDKPDLCIQVKHGFRFMVEFLANQGFITSKGVPIDLSGLASHLFYTEPANFVFCNLLVGKVFHNICQEDEEFIKDGTLSMEGQKQIMVILCNVFERQPIHPYVMKYLREELSSLPSPSKVLLEPLPEYAKNRIDEYNERVLELYRRYVLHVVSNLDKHQDRCMLPLSSVSWNNAFQKTMHPNGILKRLIERAISYRSCSPFVALSGHGDSYRTMEELIKHIKQRVVLDISCIPTFSMRDPTGNISSFNRYALDFYEHGSSETISKYNGLVSGNAWHYLANFNFVLKKIVVALRQLSDEDPIVDVFSQISARFSNAFYPEYKKESRPTG